MDAQPFRGTGNIAITLAVVAFLSTIAFARFIMSFQIDNTQKDASDDNNQQEHQP